MGVYKINKDVKKRKKRNAKEQPDEKLDQKLTDLYLKVKEEVIKKYKGESESEISTNLRLQIWRDKIKNDFEAAGIDYDIVEPIIKNLSHSIIKQDIEIIAQGFEEFGKQTFLNKLSEQNVLLIEKFTIDEVIKLGTSEKISAPKKNRSKKKEKSKVNDEIIAYIKEQLMLQIHKKYSDDHSRDLYR